MTLTDAVLVKLAAAPDDRLPAVMAALDGRGQAESAAPESPFGSVVEGLVRIDDAMREYRVSRATVGRKIKASGLVEKHFIGGFKWYEPDGMKRAMERRPAAGKR